MLKGKLGVRFSINNGIIRWQVGPFQSRKHYPDKLSAFLAGRKFLAGIMKKKLPTSHKKIVPANPCGLHPVKKPHLTLVP